MIRCALALVALSILYLLLPGQQWLSRHNLPALSPAMSANSQCLAKFMSDVQTFVFCLDRHVGRKCLLDNNRMINREDEHRCIALITTVPNMTFGATVLTQAHDVYYVYLKPYSECMGLAVEMEDFAPCFRREVFARFGGVAEKCRNESGLAADSAPPSSPLPPQSRRASRSASTLTTPELHRARGNGLRIGRRDGEGVADGLEIMATSSRHKLAPAGTPLSHTPLLSFITVMRDVA